MAHRELISCASNAPTTAVAAWVATIFLPFACHADDAFTFREALDDTKGYFTAPVRWDSDDWLYLAGTVTMVAVSHEFDSRVRTHFSTGSNAALSGKDKNSLRDAAPTLALIAGTFSAAALLNDSDGYRESWSLLEAGVFSTVTAEALSYAAGRERPDATTSPNRWRHGGDSFPSVHSTAAFAVGMVFAESGNDDYRWIRRILGYGIAGATAYVRIRENDHWLSDTVAGAALGIATARFVLNREASQTRGSWQVQPLKDGWSIAYTLRTH